MNIAFDQEEVAPCTMPYIADAQFTSVSFVVVCDRSMRLAGLWLVHLAFWKGLPDALHTCCYPADGDYN